MLASRIEPPLKGGHKVLTKSNIRASSVCTRTHAIGLCSLWCQKAKAGNVLFCTNARGNSCDTSGPQNAVNKKATQRHATNPQRAGPGASGSPEHFLCWPSRFSAPYFRIPGCGWSSCSGMHAEPQSSPPCTPAFHSKSSMCWLDAGGLRKACSCVQAATDLHAGADPGLKIRVLLDQVLATVRECERV